jgi:hypothetical protein
VGIRASPAVRTTPGPRGRPKIIGGSPSSPTETTFAGVTDAPGRHPPEARRFLRVRSGSFSLGGPPNHDSPPRDPSKGLLSMTGEVRVHDPNIPCPSPRAETDAMAHTGVTVPGRGPHENNGVVFGRRVAVPGRPRRCRFPHPSRSQTVPQAFDDCRVEFAFRFWAPRQRTDIPCSPQVN